MTALPPSVTDNGSTGSARAATAILLDCYLNDVRKLVLPRADPQLHARLHRELQAIRRSCALGPELSLAWLHLLVAHAELAHGVWSDECAHCAIPSLERRRQLRRVIEAAAELRRHWLRLQDASP